jgi:hypothetical protein
MAQPASGAAQISLAHSYAIREDAKSQKVCAVSRFKQLAFDGVNFQPQSGEV